jgi:hypothetical protein
MSDFAADFKEHMDRIKAENAEWRRLGAEANGHAEGKRIAVLIRGDQVPLRAIKWAWKHRFAFGKIALIAGDPGLGKSQIALDIVARHTTGKFWPVDGGQAQIAEAVVLTAEDGLNDIVAPRLVVAGADMSKLHFLTGTKAVGGTDEELFDLTRDVEVLRDVLREYPRIKIIVIDPLTAYLGETQAHRNSQVRKVLAPLVRLIEETGVLVIGITHLNKSQGKAIYRVLDSIAFVAVGRILHLVIEDAENPDIKKFICDKTNIGPKPAGLTFVCQLVPFLTEEGKEEHVSQISWGTSPINETADQALAAADEKRSGERSDLAAAEDFLRDRLADGAEVKAKDAEEHARALGIMPRTLRRARKKLGVIARRESEGQDGRGQWLWSLPLQGGQEFARGPYPQGWTPCGNLAPLQPSTPRKARECDSGDGLDIPSFLRRANLEPSAPALGPPGDSLDDLQ